MTKLIHVESVETYLGATYRFYVRGVSFARRPPGPARWRPRGRRWRPGTSRQCE